MSITIADVRAALDPDEPNYDKAANLGIAAMPFLQQLVRAPDLLLAAKATYLAARIGGPGAIQVLLEAASHADGSMRVSAAAGSASVPPREADQVLATLLTDPDAGVRKVAVRSAAMHALTPSGKALRDHLVKVAEVDGNPSVRMLARGLIK